MECLFEDSKYILLIEKNISKNKFHQRTSDMLFSALEFPYGKCIIKIKITISRSMFDSSNIIIDEEPILLRCVSNDCLSLVLKVKKSDLVNESKKEIKHVKHSICHSDLIAKVFVSVPPADEKPSMTYSEWRVSHPLQGGSVSPR